MHIMIPRDDDDHHHFHTDGKEGRKIGKEGENRNRNEQLFKSIKQLALPFSQVISFFLLHDYSVPFTARFIQTSSVEMGQRFGRFVTGRHEEYCSFFPLFT